MSDPITHEEHWTAYGEKLTVTKTRIKKFLDIYIPILGLQDWEICCEYCPCPPEEDMHHAGADCKVQWDYKTATIRWVMSALTENSEDQIEYVVVHEMCHILVNQMRDVWVNKGDAAVFCIRHEERVVTELAKSFLRARRWKEEETAQ